MWDKVTRKLYSGKSARYASDLTDRVWALMGPLFPGPKKRGRPRTTPVLDVLNALMYMLCTGCHWRSLPKDFPPYQTVQNYFYLWRDNGLLAQINHVLIMDLRELVGREASPTAGVIDSQSVKTTESGGERGYDAAKATKGRKRSIVVDTEGNLLGVIVHAANIQDRDGAVETLASVRYVYPWMRHIFADGGYAGEKLVNALKEHGSWTIEIIKRSDKAEGFKVLPRRWVVERTFGWLGRNRRLSKDYERNTTSSVAWILLASIKRTARRIALISANSEL